MAEAGFCERLRHSVARTKAVNADLEATTLQRCLTSTDLALMGIGAMLGSGVYILTGEVAGQLAGPAATLSFLIAGIVSLLTALLYTECATRLPRTGASYLFAYVGLGELVGFLVGWNVIVMRIFIVAFAGRGWSAYFDNIIDYRILNFTVEHLLRGVEWDLPVIVHYPDILGGAVVLVGAIPIMAGTALSAKANAVFVIVNVITVAMMFVVSMIYGNFSYLTLHGFFPKGFSGVITGAAVCLGSGYGGFESILFSAEEAKNPSRGLPFGIISAYVVAILNYLAGVISISVLSEYQNINPLSPFVTAFEDIGLTWMKFLVGIGGLCSMTGGVLSTIFCLSRNIFAMARDGLLPAFLARTNDRTKTPMVATLFGSILSICVTLFVDFVFIIKFISLAVLADFVVVGVAVISLRYRAPIIRSKHTLTAGGEVANEAEITTEVEMAHRRSPLETAGASDETDIRPSSESKKTESTLVLSESPARHRVRPRLLSFCFVAKRWMSTRPKIAVLASLCIHLLFEGITVALVTYKNDALRKADPAVILGVTLCGGLALISCWSLLVLPQYNEGIPFKVPLMPYLPLLSLLCNIILALQIELLAWIQLVVWVAAGVIVYCIYGMDHSVAGKDR